jgi:hypothetical protein
MAAESEEVVVGADRVRFQVEQLGEQRGQRLLGLASGWAISRRSCESRYWSQSAIS